jgi:butyryl-CoA dehydrogenase
MFITNSGTKLTGFVLVAANTGPTPDARSGSSVFIVESNSVGFSVGPNLKKMGWRSSDTHQLFFDDCGIPASSLLGEEGSGLRQLLRTLDFGRIQIAALAVGLTQAALDLALNYANERRAFGRPIADFQGISFKLADMEVGVRAARLLTLEAAWRRDRGLDFSQEAACAKLFASELAMRAANACLQIHGGYGFMDDSSPSRLFRDAKILEIGEGTSEIQRLVIARKLSAGLLLKLEHRQELA